MSFIFSSSHPSRDSPPSYRHFPYIVTVWLHFENWRRNHLLEKEGKGGGSERGMTENRADYVSPLLLPPRLLVTAVCHMTIPSPTPTLVSGGKMGDLLRK